MSAIDDIFSSVRDATKERLSSPIGGYFLISWVAWNHKLVLAIFFGDSLESRYEALSSLYPSTGQLTNMWIVHPLYSTMVILLAIPILNLIVSLWSHTMSALTKTIQHKIESPDIISTDQMKKLKEEIQGMEHDHNIKIRDMQNTIRKLEQSNNSLLTEKGRLSGDLSNTRRENEKLRAKNGELSEIEKQLITIIGETRSGAIPKDAIVEHSGITMVDYGLAERRLMGDLSLITKDKNGNIHLTDQGVSTYLKIKD